MNDSFLEELELVSSNVKQVTNHPVDRNITTRAVTSSPLHPISGSKLENFMHRKSDSKQHNKEFTREQRRTPDPKKQPLKTRVFERRDKPVENKLKPLENRVRPENKEVSEKEDIKVAVQDPRLRIGESKVAGKDRTRRSGSYKENSLSSNISTKENNRPSDSSKDSTSHLDAIKDKCKKCDCPTKKADANPDPVVLLNAIKDLISTYTKQESSKILQAMQELHINSQASLIKNLLCQTDDLVKEIQPCRDAEKIKFLMEENERLQADLTFLRRRNEELKRRLEELESSRPEAVARK